MVIKAVVIYRLDITPRNAVVKRNRLIISFTNIIKFANILRPCFSFSLTAIGPAAGVASGWKARFLGLSPTPTRRTMSNTYCGAPDHVLQLRTSTACELLPELASYGLQGLIELESSAVFGAVSFGAPWCDSTAATATAPAI